MITCPKCRRQTAEGAFCERCGAELPAPVSASAAVPMPATPTPAAEPPRTFVHDVEGVPAVPSGREWSGVSTIRETHPMRDHELDCAAIDAQLDSVDARIEHETSDEALLRKQRGEPTLSYDRLCTLFEGMTGSIRFRFDPTGGGERVENVIITFSNPRCEEKPVYRIRHACRTQDFTVDFPQQAAGFPTWELRLEYHSTRRKHELVGQFPVVIKPVKSSNSGSFVFNPHIDIRDVKEASDVRVNMPGIKGLEIVNPSEEMQRIAMSRDRDWQPISLSDDNEVVSLPPMPAGAQTERVILDFGSGRRLHLFSGRTIRFGKTRELNDFVLRPGRPLNECSEGELIPYKMVSRRHCFFEHAGERMTITDGSREANGVLSSSTNGTFWNDGEIRGSLELPVGTTGVVSFGRPACAGGLSMELKVCRASKACATCPHSNIHWCGEGKRPSLMLSRLDGLPEKYVAVWSCFWLGDADSSLDGVVIFRKDGAFAFRDTYRSGWIVPGSEIQTDDGTVKVLDCQRSTLNS